MYLIKCLLFPVGGSHAPSVRGMCGRCLGLCSTRIWVSGCRQEQCGAALHERRSLGRYRLCPVATLPGLQVLLALLQISECWLGPAEGKSSEG